ncbi:MAG: malto-oligosyltrehalose trehalohydrolase [Bacteroidota bacterium]|nr:malto-oligosyltrehalose trehalohydrolase [Bacteroidota bacterium]
MLHHVGAIYEKDGTCTFRVWAPLAKSVDLLINVNAEFSNVENNKTLPLQKIDYGYWAIQKIEIAPDTRYHYILDGHLQRPDPASLSQPEGVHGPSAVVNHYNFNWTDTSWNAIPLKEMIIYELHVGSFSAEETFEGVVSKIEYLKELGINAIEIMPVAQFPGSRNWGYDGVFPFAVQHSYGGADGLKKLVDACHKAGIAVILDVVYNHMGPEGNYLNDFGPYFTDKYSTPWGKAINFDDAYCDPVRSFFIQNALMWFRDFHIDALRLDAVHAIKDLSAKHLLRELVDETILLQEAEGKKFQFIAESDLNDVRFINPTEKGGYGLQSQWVDEFHHALHAVVTGEKNGYYSDFGDMANLKKAFTETYVYNGNYSEHRKKFFGSSAKYNPASQFVVFTQNHDQVGNRMLGERLSQLVSFEMLKLIAGTLFVSPYIPMLFMGEEYGEKNPFQYFVSHSDPDLVQAVREGRKKEFEAFHLQGEAPDPQSEATLKSSSLQWNYKNDPQSEALFNFYKYLIQLRKVHKVFNVLDKNNLKVEAFEDNKVLTLERWAEDKNAELETSSVFCVMNFGKNDVDVLLHVNEGNWHKILDSADAMWLGPGRLSDDIAYASDKIKVSAESIVVYETK